jgi:5'-nucleotidase (lipoprotein e(P4) family)
MKFKFLLILFSITYLSCSSYQAVSEPPMDQNERFVLATLWMETAAECKALQLQAYNLARYRIEDYIKKNRLTGNEAVVLDIDETVLETSLYQTMMIVSNITWPHGWDDFIEKADCRPIAGSVEFLKFADSVGLKIFYVSNRTEAQRNSLVTNLKKYDIPQIDNSSILLKTNISGKDERRNHILNKYEIILLVGDNLGDFSDFLNKGDYKNRINSVFEMRNNFGEKFIILPNPTYGDWEGALNSSYWKLSSAERDSIRKSVLKGLIE